jgi:Sulfotransferase family
MSFVTRIDAYHEQAIAASGGLSDFGAPDYLEPMRMLLSDVDAHCRLSPLGEQVVTGNIIGHLVGRLVAHDGFKRHPEYAGAAVEKPLIIVGAMRTGTTALQSLLLSCPDNQGLELWLANAPMPRPSSETWESNLWYQHNVKALEQFYQAAPIKGAHPMQADRPDECFWVLDHTLWSPPKSMFITVPRYLDWCLEADASYAYRYYRKVLGLIAGGSSKRWVLKSPCNIWGLDALLNVFSDACVVFTHRDIMTAMTSTASVAYAIHHPIEPDLTPAQIGKQVVRDWGRALDKAEKVRSKHDPARFVDVHAGQLQSDPVGTVERIYQHFKLPFSEENRQRLEQQSRTDPRAGHVVRQYKPEDFGLKRDEVIAQVGDYHERLISLEACQT